MTKRLPPLPRADAGSGARRRVPTWFMTAAMAAALLRLSPSSLPRRLSRPGTLLAPREELRALLTSPRSWARSNDGRRATVRRRLATPVMILALLGADWWFRTGRGVLRRTRAAMENDLLRGALAAVPVLIGVVLIVRS